MSMLFCFSRRLCGSAVNCLFAFLVRLRRVIQRTPRTMGGCVPDLGKMTTFRWSAQLLVLCALCLLCPTARIMSSSSFTYVYAFLLFSASLRLRGELFVCLPGPR